MCAVLCTATAGWPVVLSAVWCLLAEEADCNERHWTEHTLPLHALTSGEEPAGGDEGECDGDDSGSDDGPQAVMM